MRQRLVGSFPLFTDVKSTMFRQSLEFICSYQCGDGCCDIMWCEASKSVVLQDGPEFVDTVAIPLAVIQQMPEQEMADHTLRDAMLVALRQLFLRGKLEPVLYPLAFYSTMITNPFQPTNDVQVLSV